MSKNTERHLAMASQIAAGIWAGLLAGTEKQPLVYNGGFRLGAQGHEDLADAVAAATISTIDKIELRLVPAPGSPSNTPSDKGENK